MTYNIHAIHKEKEREREKRQREIKQKKEREREPISSPYNSYIGFLAGVF